MCTGPADVLVENVPTGMKFQALPPPPPTHTRQSFRTNLDKRHMNCGFCPRYTEITETDFQKKMVSGTEQ